MQPPAPPDPPRPVLALEPPEVSPPPTRGQTPVDQPSTHTQHYRDVLCELVDIGAEIARMFLAHARLQHQTVEAGAHPHAPIDFSIPYEGLTRAVRRTIALAQKLDHPVAAKPANTAEPSRTASRRQIIREVEDAIERQPSDTSPENLRDELRTRLDAPDLEDDIETRPIADIIAEICHDLGLDHAPPTPPWKRRTPEDIARLYACAIAPPKNARPFRTYTGNEPPRPKRERTAVLF